MASRPKPDAPTVVRSVVLIPIDQIDIGQRLRAIDQVWAKALGQIIKAEGQQTPIEVCRLPGRKTWTLVAGAHRVVGHRIAGIAEIEAVQVENDASARLKREISENLFRRDLEPLDRAAFIAELVILHKMKSGVDPAKDGRAASAAVRWQQALDDEALDATETISVAYGWAETVGEQLGYSGRTIRNDLLLHRRIPAGLIGRLRAANDGRGHDALRNAAQLRALAKLDEDQQVAAVDRLLFEEQAGDARKPMTLADAIKAGLAKNKAPKTAGDKHFSAFIGAFQRMGLAEKKGALAKLADILPAGYKLTFGEQLTSSGFPEGYEEEREKALVAIEGARDVIFGILEDSLGGEDVRIDEERAAALGQAEHDLGALNLAILADRVPLDTPKGDRA